MHELDLLEFSCPYVFVPYEGTCSVYCTHPIIHYVTLPLLPYAALAFEVFGNQCDNDDDCEESQICLAVGSVGQRICTDRKFPHEGVYNLNIVLQLSTMQLYCM